MVWSCQFLWDACCDGIAFDYSLSLFVIAWQGYTSLRQATGWLTRLRELPGGMLHVAGKCYKKKLVCRVEGEPVEISPGDTFQHIFALIILHCDAHELVRLSYLFAYICGQIGCYGSLHELYGSKTLQVLAEILPNGVSYEIVLLHPVWKVPVALMLDGWDFIGCFLVAHISQYILQLM